MDGIRFSANLASKVEPMIWVTWPTLSCCFAVGAVVVGMVLIFRLS